MKKRLVISLFILVLLLNVASCSSKMKQPDSIMVFADRSLESCMNTLAGELSVTEKISVTFQYGDTSQLAETLRQTGGVDLILFAGEPLAKQLVKEKIIDNYLLFASNETNKETFFMAKPMKSSKYAQAQKFADLINSDKGQEELSKFGFLPK